MNSVQKSNTMYEVDIIDATERISNVVSFVMAIFAAPSAINIGISGMAILFFTEHFFYIAIASFIFEILALMVAVVFYYNTDGGPPPIWILTAKYAFRMRNPSIMELENTIEWFKNNISKKNYYYHINPVNYVHEFYMRNELDVMRARLEL